MRIERESEKRMMGMKKLAALVMALVLCLVAMGAMAEDLVVQVTTGSDVIQYADLKAAFESTQYKNATGDVEVKLLADSTLNISDVSNGYEMVKQEQKVVLLLNGKKMMVDAGNQWTPLMIEGNLTIKGTGSLDFGNTWMGFYVHKDGTLRMERVDCKYKKNQMFVGAYDNATVQFLGGSYDVKGFIQMENSSEAEISADVYDSLIGKIGSEGVNEPKIEKAPSWAPVITGNTIADLPQTGDNTSLMLWASMLALAAAGFAASRKVRFN